MRAANSLPGERTERLDSFNKDEWRQVARRVRPDIDDDAYDAMWAAFIERKRMRRLN